MTNTWQQIRLERFKTTRRMEMLLAAIIVGLVGLVGLSWMFLLRMIPNHLHQWGLYSRQWNPFKEEFPGRYFALLKLLLVFVSNKTSLPDTKVVWIKQFILRPLLRQSQWESLLLWGTKKMWISVVLWFKKVVYKCGLKRWTLLDQASLCQAAVSMVRIVVGSTKTCQTQK